MKYLRIKGIGTRLWDSIRKTYAIVQLQFFFPVLVMQAHSYKVFVKYQTKSNGLVTETITKYKNLFTCFMLSQISLIKQNKIVQLDLR